MAVRIVTDSTADIDPALARELGIEVVPLIIAFGEQEYRDGVDLDTDASTAAWSRRRSCPTRRNRRLIASARSTGRCCADGHEVLSIHISAKLSGTLNAAHTARADLGDDGARIDLLDSRSVSIGMGAGVIAAARAAREGASLAEARAAAESALGRTHIVALVATLEYLQRGGRIGRAASMVGTLLRVKPLVEVADGEVAPFERVRTHSRAVERLYDVATGAGDLEALYVGCGTNVDEAEALAARLREALPGVPVSRFTIGPAIGVNAGPEVLGVALLRRDT
ncbi:MAG: DegV family protein [Dehalococcoidia bacterium]|nr:DegV family protein [Dehalococcoidia bacterium]